MARLILMILALLIQATAASAQPADTLNIPTPVLDVYAKAYAEDWVQFGGGFHQIYLYLPRTIKATARGTKTVWGVNVQSMSGADTLCDLNTSRRAITKQREEAHFPPEKLEKYATYLMTKIQWEVDCVHQRTRIIQFLDYDEEGNMIFSHEMKSSKLDDPVPDSNGEGLLKAFCDPQHRNHFRDLLDGKPAKR
jgi:hypothetical protein